MKLLPLIIETAGWLPVVITALLSLLAFALLLQSLNTRNNSGLAKALLSIVSICGLVGLGLLGYRDWTQYIQEVIISHSGESNPTTLAEAVSKKLLTTYVYSIPAGLFSLLFVMRSLAGVLKPAESR